MTGPRTVDCRRLLRALRLSVEEIGPGRYRLTGGREPHIVDVCDGGRWACDCTDAAMRPAGRCKHVLAVYLSRQLARPVRAALLAATAESR